MKDYRSFPDMCLYALFCESLVHWNLLASRVGLIIENKRAAESFWSSESKLHDLINKNECCDKVFWASGVFNKKDAFM